MSDFNYTKTNPKGLDTSARSIEESIIRIESAISTIDESLRSLETSWTGEGSTAFFDRYNIDINNFNMLIKKLKLLNGQLSQAAGIYDKADDEANNIVSNLSIG
ncbi:MAG: WXG100 family type VII secretion target [Oscillospiraceae bacterium]|nr:WXG100 family type VII secretion target [Oscillospiraceae bacterium]